MEAIYFDTDFSKKYTENEKLVFGFLFEHFPETGISIPKLLLFFNDVGIYRLRTVLKKLIEKNVIKRDDRRINRSGTTQIYALTQSAKNGK